MVIRSIFFIATSKLTAFKQNFTLKTPHGRINNLKTHPFLPANSFIARIPGQINPVSMRKSSAFRMRPARQPLAEDLPSESGQRQLTLGALRINYEPVKPPQITTATSNSPLPYPG
jgi:hypothetical protein